jgi:VWFA-related protein
MSKRSLALAAIVLAIPLAAISQAASDEKPATPQATTPADKKPAPPAKEGVVTSSKDQGFLIRQVVRRVPVEVVVTDKQGNPVRGLKKGDFTVREDKKQQNILAFDYEDGSVDSFVPPKIPALPANTYVNLPSVPERGPLYVLYYDVANTGVDDQMFFRSQLLKFVDTAPPGTRIALFANTVGLHMLQGFTTDHTLLRAAINHVKGPGPHLPNVFLLGGEMGGGDTGAALGTLKIFANYLNGIEGRKNLIWLADSFPIPSYFYMDQLALGDQNLDRIKVTFAALLRSQITLYTVNVSGVGAGAGGGARWTGFKAAVDQDNEDTVARYTGGRAYYGNNHVDELIHQAVDHGSSFYTLTYSPSNANFDGQERKIDITLKKGSPYSLSYRRRYFALPESAEQAYNKKDPLHARLEAAKAEDTLCANMEPGAPMLHDLLFSARLSAEGQPQMATADQMLQLADAPAFYRKYRENRPLKPLPPVALQKYRITYGIFDPQLKVLAKHKGTPLSLEFVAAAYDDDGKLLNGLLNEGTASSETKPDGQFAAAFRAEQELQVPPGAKMIRVAVRSKVNNRTGTLEIPLPLKAETPVAIAKAN